MDDFIAGLPVGLMLGLVGSGLYGYRGWVLYGFVCVPCWGTIFTIFCPP